MQKLLIILGAAPLAAGLFWPWLSKLGIGRLPGDIFIQKDNVSFYIPITTMIIISIVLTVILRFLGK